jgi:hypothetical protein
VFFGGPVGLPHAAGAVAILAGIAVSSHPRRSASRRTQAAAVSADERPGPCDARPIAPSVPPTLGFRLNAVKEPAAPRHR